MSTIKVVEILWEDACSLSSGWTREEELTPLMCVTVGILLKQDKESIQVAASVNDSGQRGTVWRIPTGMIRKVRTIGVLKTFKGEAID